MYRQLPRVPTTRFIPQQELTSDILFSGYRPIVSPVRENPLFQAKVKELSEEQNNASSSMLGARVGGKEVEAKKPEHSFMAGPNGTGGILSGGVNGTWRYNPRIPNKLLQSALWSSSAMGMEYYPEWKDVPNKVSSGLKPFQLDQAHERKMLMKLPTSRAEELTDEKSVDQYEQVVQQYLQQWKLK